jgi:alpha-mannosidase
VKHAVYYHTHWDREWYQPFRTYQLRLADVVDEILERLENDELPCFTLDGQVIVLADYLALRPENRERLRVLIVAGRLDIGPWLVMPDEFLVSGESLVRNLAEGIRRAREWGCHRFTGYLPDTFGHSADMPAILRQCGMDSAIVWRGLHPETSLFRWESPSGDAVRTLHLTDGYFQMMLDDWTLSPPQRIDALKTLLARLEAARTGSEPVLIPLGGDHLAPLPPAGRRLLLETLPDVRETTPARYMAEVSPETPLKTVRGELVDNQGSFLLPGVYSSRLYLKQANRRLEHALTHRLEPLLALVQVVYREKGLVPPRYPAQELALAWETLILNHPHDSICGCSVDAVHRENEVRFDQVRQIADSLLCQAERQVMRAFSGCAETGFVMNTGDRPYTGVVEVVETLPPEAGNTVSGSNPDSILAQLADEAIVLEDHYLDDPHRIPLSHLTCRRRTGWVWVDDAPSFGIKRLANTTGLPLRIAPVRITADRLENGRLSAQVEADGTLSVTDAQTGRHHPGLLQFQDRLEQGDSYNSAPVPGDTPLTARFLGAQVVADGPLVGILALEHEFPGRELRLRTLVRLDADAGRLDFETGFINTFALLHKLQVGFSTRQPVERMTAESHFSIVERTYDPDYHETAHMPVAPMRELKANTGPVQRFFSANGHAWLTEGLTEYEVAGNQIWITLLRSFSVLSRADSGVRGAQAGPPFETPEGACPNRTLTCRYAWRPTTPEDPAELYTAASRFYGDIQGFRRALDPENTALKPQNTGPLSVSRPECKPDMAYSLVHWDAPALTVSACYWQPVRGLILRLINTIDRPVTTRIETAFAWRWLHRVDFLEEIQETLAEGPVSAATVSLPPNAIQTLLFEID